MYFNVFMLLLAFLLICSGILLLAVNLGTRVIDSLAWFFYSGKAEAAVSAVENADLQVSRRLVEEQQENGLFKLVQTASDRNYAYPVFGNRFGGKKEKIIWQWTADGKTWRGHYPYWKKHIQWKAGERTALHYNPKRPWQYSVHDPVLWRETFLHCLLDISLAAFGIYLMMSLII